MSSFSTLPEMLQHINKNVDNDTFLNYLEDGVYKSISSDEFIENVCRLATAFEAYGVKKGDTVAIISDSSPFWLIVDYALGYIGAVSVPIFSNISRVNLLLEIKDANIEYMYIASQEQFDLLEDYISDMTLVVGRDIKTNDSKVIMWDDFIKGCEPKGFIKHVEPDDLATIIYTSGSMGVPKGVELTHKNLVSQIKDTADFFPINKGDVALSFLPLAHIFERMVMSFYLYSGISIYFVNDTDKIVPLLKEVKPTMMTVVPRVLEKIYAKIYENIECECGFKSFIAKLALKRATNKEPNSQNTLMDNIYDKLVYSKLRDIFGGDMRYLVSGGAPLSDVIYRFFLNIGMPLLQGYGLSEASPVVCANSPKYNKYATCGKTFNHVKVKLSDDGELLARGDNIMKGYHNQEDKTKEVLKDGWLYTGDLASIDDEGFITIKSRKKELYKTSTGKYVAALPIEQKLTHSRYIDYAMVIAEGRKFVSAILFLDFEVIGSRLDKDVKILIEKIVSDVNKNLNEVSKIKKYHIATQIPSIQNGILTPSMKLARTKVEGIFKTEIKSMYK